MTQVSRMMVRYDALAWRHEDDAADRWPAPYPALFAISSAAFLWAVIITGVSWLIG